MIVKYLEKVKEENRKRNPDDVKVPSLKELVQAIVIELHHLVGLI